jgi:hypothetical protein
LPLNRFARLAQTNRTTLKQQVERGLVKLSAWVADRPVFSLSDLGRIIAELHQALCEQSLKTPACACVSI